MATTRKTLQTRIHDALFAQVKGDESLDSMMLQDFLALLGSDADEAKLLTDWVTAAQSPDPEAKSVKAKKTASIKELSVRYRLHRALTDDKGDKQYVLLLENGKDATKPPPSDKESKTAVDYAQAMKSYGEFNSRFHRTVAAAVSLASAPTGEYQIVNGTVNVKGSRFFSAEEIKENPMLGNNMYPVVDVAGRSVKTLNDRALALLNVKKTKRASTSKRKSNGAVSDASEGMNAFNRAASSGSQKLQDPDKGMANQLVMTLFNALKLTHVVEIHGNELNIDIGQLQVELVRALKLQKGFDAEAKLSKEQMKALPEIKVA